MRVKLADDVPNGLDVVADVEDCERALIEVERGPGLAPVEIDVRHHGDRVLVILRGAEPVLSPRTAGIWLEIKL